MQRDLRSYPFDIQDEAESIVSFTAGMTLAQYEADRRTRRAVERSFEIIGEALVQAARDVADITAVLPDAKRMIAFRNVLIHNYSVVNDAQVWAAVQDAAELAAKVRQKLKELA